MKRTCTVVASLLRAPLALLLIAAGSHEIAVGTAPAAQPDDAKPAGGSFDLKADAQTGFITSLRQTNRDGSMEYVRPGSALGEVRLRVRSGSEAWRELSRSADGVELKSEFRPDGGTLRWEVGVRNTGNEPTEIGDLALPLPMNADYTWNHDETFKQRVFKHAFITGHGSFLYWLPVQGTGSILVMQPVDGTSLEFFTAVGMDYAHGREQFTVFIHSKASAEMDRRGTWRQPRTSRILKAGEHVTHSFVFRFADSHEGVRELIYQNGGVDVHVTPGMTVPRDMEVRIALRTRHRIEGLDAEFPKEATIESIGSRGEHTHLYRIKFTRLGENLLTVRDGGGRSMPLEFFVTEPLETLIKKRAAFIVKNQQHRDPAKWYDGLLQCDQPITVWGWCEPGENVTVSFSGQSVQTTADASGRWKVALAALKATGRPDTMSITTKTESLRFQNVVVGEVWVNSGQSNAGFVMSATLGFEEEQPKATNTAIRCFLNAKAANVLPQRRNLGEWRVLSPETVGRMSGMGYYFAKFIHRGIHAPVGIIEANHGGSTIFSWTTEAALASSPKFETLAAQQKLTCDEAMRHLPLVEQSVRAWVAEARKNDALTRPMMPFPIDASPVRPFYSSFLQNPAERRGCMFYHTMIQPMIGYGIRGVLWNQGEADGNKTAIYDDLMATMVADWRKQWGHEFPFYFVQMPARKGDASLLSMWQAQTQALVKIPNSGMIVCNDISEPGTRYEVHPRDKKNVGERHHPMAVSMVILVRLA